MLRRYRFLLQPRWLVLTAVVLLAMPLFSLASSWQFSRLADLRASNAQVAANESAPVIDLLDLTGPMRTIALKDQWRTVEATGVFVAEDLLVRRKSYEQQTGYWVVSRLRLTDGPEVLVVRGWIPTGVDARTPPRWQSAPEGVVTVTGRARPATQRPGTAPTDLPEGQLDELYPDEVAADAGLVVGSTLINGFVEATGVAPQQPTPSDDGVAIPRPVEPPSLSERNHWSYAWQWRAFILLAIVGWFILVRAQASREDLTVRG